MLYVPGNDEKKLQKIPTLNVDCAVMDCEDGVAANRKVFKGTSSQMTQHINKLVSTFKCYSLCD